MRNKYPVPWRNKQTRPPQERSALGPLGGATPPGTTGLWWNQADTPVSGTGAPTGVQVQVLPDPPNILRDGRPGLGRFHKPPTACSTQGPATNLRPVLPTAGCLAHIEAMGVRVPHRARGRGATGRRTTLRTWSLWVRIPPTAPSLARPGLGDRREPRRAGHSLHVRRGILDMGRWTNCGDMGRQRPTCFGNRHRPGASPGSPTKIFELLSYWLLGY